MAWVTDEIVDGRRGRVLNIILPTEGCSYDNCYMCSYTHNVEPEEDLLGYIKKELDGKDVNKVKIFTSGSFLDKKELKVNDQKEIFSYLSRTDVKEVSIETRPEFVDRKRLEELKDILNKTLEIAIGLESANNHVLKYCINKGFSYSDFLTATDILSTIGIKIKVYVFLKPLFLTEYEAILDTVNTCETIEEIADSVSINPMTIHKNTLAEYLWRRQEYRPPWIWSLVEVLNAIADLKFHTICHPVALGKRRGVHNCGECDHNLKNHIASYSLKNQEIEYYHECKEKWEQLLKREW